MVNDFVQERLRAAFPQNTDPLVYRAVREGVMLADHLLETNEILNTLIGADLRGHIRRAGVFMKLHDFCAKDDLPFSATYSKMPIGSWHFLELKSKNVTAHIHKTESSGAFPKDSPTRQIERLTNQLDLLSDEKVVSFSDILGGAGPFNAWLTLGADKKGNITHVTWKVPAKGSDDWLASIDVIAGAAGATLTPPSPKAPDPRDNMRFKEHIESAIEQNKQDTAKNK